MYKDNIKEKNFTQNLARNKNSVELYNKNDRKKLSSSRLN